MTAERRMRSWDYEQEARRAQARGEYRRAQELMYRGEYYRNQALDYDPRRKW
jgi:hypothetical protein